MNYESRIENREFSGMSNPGTSIHVVKSCSSAENINGVTGLSAVAGFARQQAGAVRKPCGY